MSEVEWFPRNSLRPSLLDSIWGIIEFSIIVLWIFSLTSIVQVYYRYSRITARERIASLRVNNFSKKEKGNRFALPSRRETMSKTKGENEDGGCRIRIIRERSGSWTKVFAQFPRRGPRRGGERRGGARRDAEKEPGKFNSRSLYLIIFYIGFWRRPRKARF